MLSQFRIWIILLCTAMGWCSSFAQSASFRHCFDKQRQLYPQERLCIITDRAKYQAGERIWFRVYVVDDTHMLPVSLDRYVYVELVDGHGFVVKRVKVMNGDSGYAGYLDIPPALYTSCYCLRCYTLYSASLNDYDCIVPVVVGNVADTFAANGNQVVLPQKTGVLHVADAGEAFKVWMDERTCFPVHLLAVARGCVEYECDMNDATPKFFRKKDFIQGVTQFVAFNDSMHTVDRQLVFSPYGDGVAELSINPVDSCADSLGRQTLLLSLPGHDSGAICVSVTAGEIDDDVPSAFAQLLLSQDIKDGVRHPDRFFNNGYMADSLNALLLQSVSDRYCVDSIVRGRYAVPPVAHEKTQVVTGWAKVTAPYAGNAAFAKVCVISPQANMYAMSEADKHGYFSLGGLDFPDSTAYAVNAISMNPHEKTEVMIDEATFPLINVSSIWVQKGKPSYTNESQYHYDANGCNMLDDVVVTAARKPHDVGTFSSMADYSVTADEIEYLDATCIHEVLRRIPCIYMKGDTAYIRGKVSIYGNPHAAVAVDGSIVDDEYDLDNIQMQDIGRIDVFKTGSAVIWGAKAGPGLISITTKKGVAVHENTLKNRVSHYVPLGYQRPETVFEDRRVSVKTVYWNGNVRLVDGKAVLKVPLYPGHKYRIMAQGVTDSGLIVHANSLLASPQLK